MNYYFQSQDSSLTGLPVSGLAWQSENQPESEDNKAIPAWVRISSLDGFEIRSKKVLTVGSTQCSVVGESTSDHGRLWQCFNSNGLYDKTAVDVPVSHLTGTEVSLMAYQAIDMHYSSSVGPRKYSDPLLFNDQRDNMAEVFREVLESEQKVNDALENTSKMLDQAPDHPYSDDATDPKLFIHIKSSVQEIHSSLTFKLFNGHSKEEEQEFQDNLERIKAGEKVIKKDLDEESYFDLYPDTSLQVSRDHFQHLIHYLNPASSNASNNVKTVECQNTPAGDSATTPANVSSAPICQDRSQGVVGHLRRYFFRYDIDHGTCTNWSRCAAAAVSVSALGGYMASQFADTITEKAEQSGNAVINYAGSHPVACGVVGGAYLTCAGIFLLSGSLKPTAVNVIEGFRNQVTSNLRSAIRRQFQHQAAVKEFAVDLRALQVDFDRERKANLKLAQEQYNEDKKRYDQRFQDVETAVLAIIGIEGVRQIINVFEPPDEAYSVPAPGQTGRESQSERGSVSGRARTGPRSFSPEALISAGVALNQFVSDKKASFWAIERLLSALKPVMTGNQYRTTRDMLYRFPLPPKQKTIRGEVEHKYRLIETAIRQNQQYAEQAYHDAETIRQRYPEYGVDENGEVTPPSVEDFWRHMRE